MALMFYLIYRITNNINNKIYVGSHKTKNKDDGYMGSGKYLKHAINKYGVENFTKEILFEFATAKEMYDKEAEIVDDNFLAEENTYNLKRGGFGGFDYINSSGKNLYGSNGQPGFGGDNLTKSITGHRMKATGRFEEWSGKISNTLRQKFNTGELVGSFKGRLHSDETKKLIGSKMSILQFGNRNSQYGSCWVTHPVLGNKKIKLADINNYISLGYNRGRKIK